MFDRTKNNIFSVIFAVALVVFIITVSIALPIYTRDFYYIQVKALDLPEKTGYTYEEIIEAYDETLDYLTIDGKEFGTGVLRYSEEGKSHFEDCRGLFDLNKYAMIYSLLTIIMLSFINKIGLISLARPCGLRLSFWSSVSTLGVFGALALVCAGNFSAAFTVFHKIFFPGKSNWMFNPYEDEIINILPQQFFMACAILICASIIILSIFFIVRAIIKRNDEYCWRV